MIPAVVSRNAAAVKAPRSAPEEMRLLSEAEARVFLDAAVRAGDRFEPLYLLAITTGLRRGELLGLRWDDAVLERGTLYAWVALWCARAGVTSRERSRPVAAGAGLTHAPHGECPQSPPQTTVGGKDAPLGTIRGSGLIFSTGAGTPINPEKLIKRSFKPLLKRAGLPEIRFHDLRHTCATLLFGWGVHPKIVQELLGHANIAMTLDIYYHHLPSMGDQASGAMGDAFG